MRIFDKRTVSILSVIFGVCFIILWIQDAPVGVYIIMTILFVLIFAFTGIIRYLESKNMVTGELLRGKVMMIASLIIIISAIARACGELAR